MAVIEVHGLFKEGLYPRTKHTDDRAVMLEQN